MLAFDPFTGKIDIHIVGDKCNIQKDTDLYFIILDCISRMMISGIDSGINFSDVDLKNDRRFLTAAEKTLRETLLIPVKVTRVQSFRDYTSLSSDIKIAIGLNLDQGYIDNYVDRETEQMIDFAFKHAGEEYADS